MASTAVAPKADPAEGTVFDHSFSFPTPLMALEAVHTTLPAPSPVIPAPAPSKQLIRTQSATKRLDPDHAQFLDEVLTTHTSPFPHQSREAVLTPFLPTPFVAALMREGPGTKSSGLSRASSLDSYPPLFSSGLPTPFLGSRGGEQDVGDLEEEEEVEEDGRVDPYDMGCDDRPEPARAMRLPSSAEAAAAAVAAAAAAAETESKRAEAAASASFNTAPATIYYSTPDNVLMRVAGRGAVAVPIKRAPKKPKKTGDDAARAPVPRKRIKLEGEEGEKTGQSTQTKGARDFLLSRASASPSDTLKLLYDLKAVEGEKCPHSASACTCLLCELKQHGTTVRYVMRKWGFAAVRSFLVPDVITGKYTLNLPGAPPRMRKGEAKNWLVRQYLNVKTDVVKGIDENKLTIPGSVAILQELYSKSPESFKIPALAADDDQDGE